MATPDPARKLHWEQVYRAKAPDAVSWFQPEASRSLAAIRALGLPLDAALVDVGGGASTLVDGLIAAGYQRVTVLDVSGEALRAARARLGERAAAAQWVEADVTAWRPPAASFDLWHDRAVFHFLTRAEDRAAYAATAAHALRPGAHAVIATFAHDGPTQCSGLPVVRYTPQALADALSPTLRPLWDAREDHTTPSGATQRFLYMGFERA